MDIYVKFLWFLYFLFFLVFNYDFITYMILPVSQLQTQQLITSQIRSHIEHLIQTYNILLLILHSKLMKNLAFLTVFNMIWWWLIVEYFFWATLYYVRMDMSTFEDLLILMEWMIGLFVLNVRCVGLSVRRSLTLNPFHGHVLQSINNYELCL